MGCGSAVCCPRKAESGSGHNSLIGCGASTRASAGQMRQLVRVQSPIRARWVAPVQFLNIRLASARAEVLERLGEVYDARPPGPDEDAAILTFLAEALAAPAA